MFTTDTRENCEGKNNFQILKTYTNMAETVQQCEKNAVTQIVGITEQDCVWEKGAEQVAAGCA